MANRNKFRGISNRLLYTLIAISVLTIIAVGVYAYGTSNPSSFGHSAAELSGVCLSNGTGCVSSSSQSRVKADIVVPASVQHGAETVIPFLSESYDVGNMHSTSSNPSRITIPSNGFYALKCQVGLGATNWGVSSWVVIKKNGIVTPATATQGGPTSTGLGVISVIAFENAASGDYYECFVSQTTGGPQQFTGNLTYFVVGKMD